MSSEPGSPRKGESASTDVVPQSRPVEASELDDGWGDAPVDPEPVVTQAKPDPEPQEAKAPAVGEVITTQSTQGNAHDETTKDAPAAGEVHDAQQPEAAAKPSSSILPQSLSPVVLSSADRRSSAPPKASEPAAKSSDTAAQPGQGATKAQPASDQPAENKPREAKGAETKPAETKPIEAAPHKPKTKDASPEPKDASKHAADQGPKHRAQHEPRHAAHVAHPGRRLGRKLRSGYVLFPVTVLAAGIALIVLRPKEIAPDKPIATQAPAAQVPVPVANQPLAQPAEVVGQAAPAVTAEPVDSAATPPATSASAVPSASAASGDSFVDAFQKNAAKSNAKWAEVKREPGKPESSGAAKSPPTKPDSAQPAAPGQADPLDVLKRLEAARKSKK